MLSTVFKTNLHNSEKRAAEETINLNHEKIARNTTCENLCKRFSHENEKPHFHRMQFNHSNAKIMECNEIEKVGENEISALLPTHFHIQLPSNLLNCLWPGPFFEITEQLKPCSRMAYTHRHRHRHTHKADVYCMCE